MYIISSHLQIVSFTSSFLIHVPFLFSCLIILTRTSNIMLNYGGESGHPSLDPYLKEKLS